MLKPSRFFWHVVFRNKLKYLFKFREFIKLRTTYNSEFVKAIEHVDLFLGNFPKEYNELKLNWPNLPPFVNLPAMANFRSCSSLQKKEDTIILGNSRNPLNNHFDILDIFLADGINSKYNMIIPFSYFNETSYSLRLREKIGLYPNISLHEKFLSLDHYELMFKKASAFVLNSLRQSALGNILLTLQNGVKIYLNEKNIIYSELISQNLFVYSIDDLYSDIANHNIGLSLEEMEHNISVMKLLAERNSVKKFQKSIMELIN